MITKDNKDLYISLFDRASKKLNREIKSLDQYFQNFGTLHDMLMEEARLEGKGLDESFYMLPLDEEPFYVNANTREIIVPAAFRRGIAVQSDHASEVLVFEIDRYFDYMDFGSPEIGIEIRYTTPDQKEYFYNVSYKDLEIKPGMVRFAWILGKEATAQPGTIKFAIRLHKTENGYTTYIWNSKSQNSTISPVLQVGTNAVEDGVESTTIFSQIISNSLPKGEIPATTPNFNAKPLATNLPEKADLDEKNELELKALATKTDGGTISYTWYYQENPYSEEKNLSNNDDNDNNYEISDSYEVIDNNYGELNKRFLARDYYYKKENGDYELYTDSIPAAEGVTLYKKYTSCKIANSDAPVIGEYWVTARNSLSEQNYSTEGKSQKCMLAGPEEPIVTKKLTLDDKYKIEEKEEEAEVQYFADEPTMVTKFTIEPSLEISIQATPGAFYKYSWKKKYDTVEEIVETEEYNGNNVVPKDGIVTLKYSPKGNTPYNIIGFYTVTFETKKNRAITETEDSGQARITNTPIAPEVENSNENISANKETNENAYILTPNVINEDMINTTESPLRVPGKEEGLSYTWFRRAVDENGDGVEVKGENDSTLRVKYEKGDICIYMCKIKNTLNGESATTNSPNYVLTG